ncbi:unnamed protein product [Amaranthus hypochondriacus]
MRFYTSWVDIIVVPFPSSCHQKFSCSEQPVVDFN